MCVAFTARLVEVRLFDQHERLQAEQHLQDKAGTRGLAVMGEVTGPGPVCWGRVSAIAAMDGGQPQGGNPRGGQHLQDGRVLRIPARTDRIVSHLETAKWCARLVLQLRGGGCCLPSFGAAAPKGLVQRGRRHQFSPALPDQVPSSERQT